MNIIFDQLRRDVCRNKDWECPEEALLIGYLFTKRHFESLQRVFAKMGANEREANALFALADSGPVSQRTLRRIMVTAPGTISDLLRSMEKRGLVAAAPLATDKREKSWVITKKGVDVLAVSLKQIYGLLPELFRGFSNARQAHFLESLNMLQQNAERLKTQLEEER